MTAAKVSVFFIDDKQVVRPQEVGSSDYLREKAAAMGCDVFEHQLEIQFRCAGSEAFVNWINTTLGIERTPNVLWRSDEAFDFRIYDGPLELERAIMEKADEGFTARVTAGFCWEWSKQLTPEGKLNEDVVIGDYRRPWNARHEATRLPRGNSQGPALGARPQRRPPDRLRLHGPGIRIRLRRRHFRRRPGLRSGPPGLGRTQGELGRSRRAQIRSPVPRPGQERLPRPAQPRHEGLLRAFPGQGHGAVLQEPHGGGDGRLSLMEVAGKTVKSS